MHSDAARFINRFILNLYPFKLPVFIRHYIKWRVLCYRIQNQESFLEQVELSLQNTQVTLFFGVMHYKNAIQDQWMGQPKVSSGLPSA